MAPQVQWADNGPARREPPGPWPHLDERYDVAKSTGPRTLRMPIRASLWDRFWAKVDKNGPIPAHAQGLGPCWIWTAGTAGNGYGSIRVGRAAEGSLYAHRQSLEWDLGRPLLLGHMACHRCDTPPCVNPRHLFEALGADNVGDMVAKGRQRTVPAVPERRARGERQGGSKLTTPLVLMIWTRHAAGEMGKDIAASLGVHRATVSDILTRKTWAWLAPDESRGQ